MTEQDHAHLRRAIALAHSARAHGNRPFGALLVDENGRVLLEAENTQLTTADSTAHAETNLLRVATPRIARSELARCTLFASGEPCPMCAGAIFWSGVGRVVYGLSAAALYEMAGDPPEQLRLSCRDVLAHGRRSVEVLGPMLEAEAARPFDGFFD